MRAAGGLIALLAAAAYMYYAAADIPVVPVPGQLGPDFWPRLALVLLMAACLLKLADLWRHRHAAPPAAGEPEGGPEAVAAADDGASGTIDLGVLAGAIALLIGYAGAAPFIGFAFATCLFLVGFMWLGGLRRPLPLVVAALVTTVAMLYLFVKVVYLPLPRGEGAFADATLAVYRLLGIF